METMPQSLTEFVVLGLVAFGDHSGYELAQIAERSVGLIWAPSRSHLYKALPRLREEGSIVGERVAQRARPDKTVYRITPEGRGALEAWLRRVEAEPAEGRVVFPLKVFFSGFVGAEAALRQLDAYEAYIDRRSGLLDSADELALGSPYASLVRDHGRRRMAATKAWIRSARLSIGSFGDRA
jgi:PadR family transcriptional regulator AphA